MIRIKGKRLLILTCLTFTILVLVWNNRQTSNDKEYKNRNEPSLKDSLLRFNTKAEFCEDLANDWTNLNMSREYYHHLTDFKKRHEKAYVGQTDGEGHSNQVPEEMRILHVLAKFASVRTVCETGFNFGHSSFNFLTANKNLRVFSFDLGNHVYARTMAVELKDMLGSDRLTVTFGDSRKTIPQFKATGGLPSCDIIFVDGGHTYEVAKEDIINLATHASRENIIIMDDHPTEWSFNFGKAWDERLLPNKQANNLLTRSTNSLNDDGQSNFHIVELMRCQKRNKIDGTSRGFVVGYVTRRGLI